jgi:anaerobic selenocysteine-containing dehydrogenase
MRSLGSNMTFDPNTIDKPGRNVVPALHGTWMAPWQGYHEPDVALLLGINPFQSYNGVACGNPAKWLGECMESGMQLIVVDPRRTDIAKRATLHIQPLPGHDPEILACLTNLIIHLMVGFPEPATFVQEKDPRWTGASRPRQRADDVGSGRDTGGGSS